MFPHVPPHQLRSKSLIHKACNTVVLVFDEVVWALGIRGYAGEK